MDAAEEIAQDRERILLRHALATLAYRGGKALGDAPAGFADFRVGEKTRTPGQILAHIGDLFDWAVSKAEGQERWHNSDPLPWDQGVDRFFSSLAAFDACLASRESLACSAETLFQAPIADALTHIGQIAMLRRLAGGPVRAENYAEADIAVGRVGPKQTPPRFEF